MALQRKKIEKKGSTRKRRTPFSKKSGNTDVKKKRVKRLPVKDSFFDSGDGNVRVRVRGDHPKMDDSNISVSRGVMDLRDTFLFRIGRFFIWIFVLSSFFAFAGSAYFFFYHNRGSGDVSLSVRVSESILYGVPFSLDLTVHNASDQILKDSELAFTLPEGLELLNIERIPGTLYSEKLGDIEGGSSHHKEYSLLIVARNLVVDSSALDDDLEIRVRLSYALGRSAGFEAREKISFKVGSAPFSINLDEGSDDVVIGTNVNVSIRYKNESSFEFEDLRMETSYPNEFSYISSSLPPDSLNNYWRLGAFPPNSEGVVEIRGGVKDVNGAMLLPVTLYGTFSGIDYPIYIKDIEIDIAPSPLDVSIIANGRDDYVARRGDFIDYKIRYENKSGVQLSNLVVKASFIGDLFDFSTLGASVGPSGVLGSLVWNSSNTPSLSMVEPGGLGELSVRVALKDVFPIFRLGDKNFSLRASVSAESSSVPYYLSGDKTRGFAEIVTNVAGEISVDARAFFRDFGAGVVNGGSLPPRVDVPTQYSIHWLVQNFSTDVRDLEVQASLPVGVEWVGLVGELSDGVLFYDDVLRKIVWNIDSVSATRGVLSSPIEAVFQVVGVPSSSSVGGFQRLLGETKATAIDVFTGVSLTGLDDFVSTSLVDDDTVGSVEGIVVE